MINQSILYPMAVKTLTRASDGASIPVIPGIIMSAQTQESGTLLLVRNERGDITPVVVTEAVATVVNGTTLFLVTPSSGAKYIRAETVADFADVRGGTLLQLLSDDNGQDKGASLLVTESVATIQTRIDAAIIAGGGGGGGGSLGDITATGSTQGTAAAITTSVVRITGGADNTGVRLTTATGAEETFVHNATTKTKVVYPATGEFIDPSLVNQGFTLGPNEAVLFKCTLAGHWVTEIQNSNSQTVTPAGSFLGGGQIKAGVTDVLCAAASFGQMAVTLPVAYPGAKITIRTALTGSPVRLFPAAGETINDESAGASIYLKADSVTCLTCYTETQWVDSTSSVQSLVVDSFIERFTGKGFSFIDALGNTMATFGGNSGTVSLNRGLSAFYEEGAASAGGGQGGRQINGTLFNCNVCATLGDSLTLIGNSNLVYVTNTGARSAYVYCALGGTMNGVTNGYFILAPGQVWQLTAMSSTSPSAWTSSLLYSGPGVYTAVAGVNRPKLVHPYATITTVTTALDEVILDDQQQSVVIVNAGANTALLLPPSGDTLNGGASLYFPARSIAQVQKTANDAWTLTYSSFGVQSGAAAAGGTQALGTKIIGPSVNATTVATVNDSFTITSESPRLIYFSNNSTRACNVFPPSSGTINGGAANAAISVAAGASYIFRSNDMFVWLAALQ